MYNFINNNFYMENFLKEVIKWEKFELLIDTQIFSKDIILKSCYNFLDKWYFFFKKDNDWNIILHFTKKEWNKDKSEKIIMDFSDELLSVSLRSKLEKDNKEIREKIIWAALSNSLDIDNFVEFDSNNNWNDNENQIDFDKDIDEILKDIESDPELKIDEEEIQRILLEIEEETKEDFNDEDNSEIKLNIEWVKNAKKKFNK